MSYLQFHLLFVLPPVVLLASILKGPLSAVGRLAWLGLPLMSVVALAYTTPWDNHLISQGVWRYGEDRVIGTVGHVPIEEYAFFVLQPLLSGLWLYNLLRREGSHPRVGRNAAARWGGASLCAAAGIAGVLLLGWEPGHYLGLILAWAGPVLAGQWAYGGHALWRQRRVLLLGVAAPTLYLWFADRLALGLGIWDVSREHTTGLAPLGLPVEEAVFFLATNLMVVQGLLLFLWVTERATGVAADRGARRGCTRRPGSAPMLAERAGGARRAALGRRQRPKSRRGRARGGDGAT